jgi:hypothetical protein
MNFEEAFIDELEKCAKYREPIVAAGLDLAGRGLRGLHTKASKGLRALLTKLLAKSGRDIEHLKKPGLMERAAEGIRAPEKESAAKEERELLRRLNAKYALARA